jgi:DNA-binding MarR family transcriptional regulator
MMTKQNALEPSHLKSHLGYHLRIVSNAVSHSFARNLAIYDVTVAEWVILREMYSSFEFTSPSVVAEITGLTRGAVSKLIDRLLRKELVTRAESQEDRRFQNIQLTPKATKLLPKLAKIADENDKTFFSHLSQSERNLLLKTLTQLTEHHKLKVNPID